LGEVIPFARAVMQAAAGPWTQAERIELARLAAAITRDGRAGYDVASGRGDGGEPWFAISMPTSGETVLHVARIGGRFIVHHVADDLAEEGHDLRALVRRAMRDVGDNLGGIGPGAAVLLLLAQAVLDAPVARAGESYSAATTDEIATAPPLPDAAQALTVNIDAAPPPVSLASPVLSDDRTEAPAMAATAAQPVPCLTTNGMPLLAPTIDSSGALPPRFAALGDATAEWLSRATPANLRDAGSATPAASATPNPGEAGGADRDGDVEQRSTTGTDLSPAAAGLLGTTGDDRLLGSIAFDEMCGGNGDDTLIGGDGDDTIVGDDGDDILIGDGEASDAVQASLAADPEEGGTEASTQPADPGALGPDDDSLSGGAGNDKLWGGRGADTLLGGAGSDTMFGGLGDDILFGHEDNDLLYGSAGNDWLAGGTGHDELLGGTGNDTLSGGEGVDLLSGEAGDDQIVGGSGRDILSGGAGNDRLFGGYGADCMVGGDGDDRMNGGDGRDTLSGGDGNDTLTGGGGPDTLDGGGGDDILRIDPGTLARGGLGADLFLIDFGAMPLLREAGIRQAMIDDFNRLEGDRYRLLDPEHTTVQELFGELGKLLISWSDPGAGPPVGDLASLPPHIPPFLHFDWLD